MLDTVRNGLEVATNASRDCTALQIPNLPSFSDLVKTDMLDVNDTNSIVGKGRIPQIVHNSEGKFCSIADGVHSYEMGRNFLRVAKTTVFPILFSFPCRNCSDFPFINIPNEAFLSTRKKI